MDRSHKLEAPNNDTLKTIEQLDDKSGVSSVYRQPGKQFEGDIMSNTQREKAKADELEALSSGLGRSAFKIGLLVPYPFISGILLASLLYILAQQGNPWTIVPGTLVAGGFWLATSYKAYSSIFKTFYNHALRAGPFLVVILASLMLALQAIYNIVGEQFATQSVLINSATVSLLTVVYSLVATFILLGVWGNSRLKSGLKVLISAAIIAISGFFLASTYLF